MKIHAFFGVRSARMSYPWYDKANQKIKLLPNRKIANSGIVDWASGVDLSSKI